MVIGCVAANRFLSMLGLFCFHPPQIPPSHIVFSVSDFSRVKPIIINSAFFRTISQIWSPTTASTISACPRGCTLIGLWWWSSVMRPLTAQKTQLHSMRSSFPMLRSTCKLHPGSYDHTRTGVLMFKVYKVEKIYRRCAQRYSDKCCALYCFSLVNIYFESIWLAYHYYSTHTASIHSDDRLLRGC